MTNTLIGENEDYENISKKRQKEIDLQGRFHIYPNGTISYWETWCTQDVIPMLWVGVHDKKGVDIYDGDLIKGFHVVYGELFEIMGQVIWNQEFFCFEVRKITGPKDETAILSLYGFYQPSLEVIGNIYQNENLLENKNV